jgi:hypothetical protein
MLKNKVGDAVTSVHHARLLVELVGFFAVLAQV